MYLLRQPADVLKLVASRDSSSSYRSGWRKSQRRSRAPLSRLLSSRTSFIAIRIYNPNATMSASQRERSELRGKFVEKLGLSNSWPSVFAREKKAAYRPANDPSFLGNNGVVDQCLLILNNGSRLTASRAVQRREPIIVAVERRDVERRD